VQWWDKQPDEPRPHLGASEIGRPCDRAIWYSFRWATKKKFPGRIKRLFDRGNREEEVFMRELKGIGAEVYDRDPVTGLQHRFKSWCIVEFKTHGNKSFTDLVAKGVEESKPEHYAQMQVYMGLAELERALYLAVNKDTDELHSEWIHFDKAAFAALLERAEKIIRADEPPPGISTDPAWWQCKMCDHQNVCSVSAAGPTWCCHRWWLMPRRSTRALTSSSTSTKTTGPSLPTAPRTQTRAKKTWAPTLWLALTAPSCSTCRAHNCRTNLL